MYIQLTTRCNMSCAHCYQDATAQGEDMAMATFRKAIALAQRNITLGGGEPTLHPRFMEMLTYAKEHNKIVTVITNGSNTEISLKLAKMARNGRIIAGISRDRWHAPIDPAVIVAFGDRVQTVITLNNAGRAKGLPNTQAMCKCAMVTVKPDGNIYACGCETELLGTVTDKAIVYPDTTYGVYCSILGNSIDHDYKTAMAYLETQRCNMTDGEYECQSARNLLDKYDSFDEWTIIKKTRGLD